ncbi:hypothetical protein AKJ63_01720 [candidate division MSBL1 archaeon SCGC-AAA259D18]|uniref:Exosome protein n=2 Tax=candidate division MSBL1 TaxID=215777 RepID=A0A133UBB9_9EURY|nr:hypothetical protein AKJ63_01720 [candidate division MSBL1 archaeon SCGC-AAA259D18]KXA91473.1 hypothetical protein AKJ57_01080 [candidate division MSBL1 archaeon SCGC-AAA259A05]
MELPFKSVAISTIVHATESEEKIRQAMRTILPDEVESERSEAEGHYGDPKIILSADVERRPHLREFWDKLLKKLDEGGREWLSRKAINRVGDDCRLYLRLDKQHAVQNDQLRFTDTGDVLHVRINISAYPAKKEIAVEKMKDFIETGLGYGRGN